MSPTRWSGLSFALLLAVAPGVATAQQKGKEQPKAAAKNMFESHAATITAAEAKAGIKKDDIANSPSANIPAPTSKGGKQLAGSAMLGNLLVDNWTDLYIRVYTDGNWVGTMAPWGQWSGYAGDCSSHAVWGIAVFTDGSYRKWGPIATPPTCGNYTWRLYP